MEQMRKETIYESDHGRDAGKTFLITEMSAYDADLWGMIASIGARKNGLDMGDDPVQSLSNVASKGVLNVLLHQDVDGAIDLTERLMKCVKWQTQDGAATRNLMSGDIEEPATRIALKLEVWNLHTSFFFTG